MTRPPLFAPTTGSGGRLGAVACASGRGRSTSRRDDGGMAAIELVTGLTLLLLPMVVLAAALPPWAETRYAVEAAAVEAGRLAATTGRVGAAEDLGTQILANHDITAGVKVDVTVPTDAGGLTARRGEAVAAVTAAVPAVDVPGMGALGGWTLSRTHREPLDPWRGRHPDA